MFWKVLEIKNSSMANAYIFFFLLKFFQLKIKGYFYGEVEFFEESGSSRERSEEWIWLSVDPLAEEYPSWSPYVYTHNNPLRYTDPTGMTANDVIINGNEDQAAFDQLQASVQGELTLKMDDKTGNVTYERTGDGKLSKDARKLAEAIDDHSIEVNIYAENSDLTESGDFYLGGAFMGNTVSKEGDNYTVSTKQEVNPEILGKMSKARLKPGADMLHEVTESYEGALISQKKGISSPAANKPGSVYPKAHRKARNQSGKVHRRLYDANGKITYNASEAVGVDWYVKGKKQYRGKNVIYSKGKTR